MAGGFSIKIKDIENFKNFVFRKFKNINEDLNLEFNCKLEKKIIKN